MLALRDPLSCTVFDWHDWEISSWGVILDVSKCTRCGRTAKLANFPIDHPKPTTEEKTVEQS